MQKAAQQESGVVQITRAAEDMTRAVQEIAKQIVQSSRVVDEAVEQTRLAVNRSESLDEAAVKIGQVVDIITNITSRIDLLALNATIEAARAGDAGKGFAVVASEVKDLARQTSGATAEIQGKVQSIQHLTQQMIDALKSMQAAILHAAEYSQNIGAAAEEQTAILGGINTQVQDIAKQFDERDAIRLIEMAQTLVQLIVRNLYERTADVRWWATDEAFYRTMEIIDNASKPQIPVAAVKKGWFSLLTKEKTVQVAESSQETPEQLRAKALTHAGNRLSIINRFYSVYVNLLLVDKNGKAIVVSQPHKHPRSVGMDVSQRKWFKDAMATTSGDQYVVDDIYEDPIHGAPVCVYATAVRRGGELNGEVLGVLGVFFDWKEQSRSIVEDEANLSEEEWQRSRVLLLDNKMHIIASSDNQGLLSTFRLKENKDNGCYKDESLGAIVAYAKTIGYQEYDGLGWYGVIIQK